MTKIKQLSTVIIFLFFSLKLVAQQQPIGYWKAHLPNNNAIAAGTDGYTIFAGSEQSFYTYYIANDEIFDYSKVEGMSDIGVNLVAFDSLTGYAIIVYNNTNIDLFKNETFFNIPDIKLKSITGTKRINQVFVENGLAYLSTSFGIVVVNLVKKEIKETYNFMSNNQSIEIKSVCTNENFIYAVTAKGIFKATKSNPNLQAFSSWTSISTQTNFTTITNGFGNLLVTTTDSVYELQSDVLTFRYKSPWSITNLNKIQDNLYINEFRPANYNGVIKIVNENFIPIDSFQTSGRPANTMRTKDGAIWVADAYYGLAKRNGENSFWNIKRPEGPASYGAFDIMPYNGEVWVAHGGFNDAWTYIYNHAGMSQLKDGKWKIYNELTTPSLLNTTDFISIAKDPNNGTIYAGSYRSGLFELKTDGTNQVIKWGVLEPTIGDTSNYRVSGLCFDANGNLWFTMAGAPNELMVRKTDGTFLKFSGAASGVYAAFPVVDDYNQKWYVVPSFGLAVYNDNYTIDNKNDDQFAKFSTSSISSTINVLVKDKDGSLWFGTSDGIGVIYCPGQMLQGSCKIDRPIVQYDQFAGYLFQNENVKALAVDGANRKWIGTANGVWLISANGDKIIYRFTSDNSPLPSNVIQKISIDPVTGDVYFGTTQGIVSFRGTATEGGTTNTNVKTFPNPVPSNYNGTIAINGLVANGDVKITDINGQLIYRTQSLGGQAVWNGKDYTGRRPQSGVYLIFVTNADGSETYAGKLVFME